LARQHDDRLAELEERYAGYEVHEREGEKIGKIDNLFVNENHELEYIGVKMGLSGAKAIMIPMGVVEVDEGRRIVKVLYPEDKVEEGPTFDDEQEITPEFEEQVRDYYGLRSQQGPAERDTEDGRTYAERAEGWGEEQPGDSEEERDEPREHPGSVEHEDTICRDDESELVGYQVYDRHYERIGKVDDLFVDHNDRPEYIGVKMGFLGTRSTLIPMDIVRVNDKRRLVEVEADKDAVQEGPTFGHDQEVTAEFEQRVLSYYQVETAQASAEREAYDPYYSDTAGDERVDIWPGERAGTHERSGDRELEDVTRGMDRERSGGLEDEDESRSMGSGDERRAETSERQDRGVNVRKRVRTERQHPPATAESREEEHVDPPAVKGQEPSETEAGNEATKDSK
jgi:ribosomal 30S subunit maturation factor RimM